MNNLTELELAILRLVEKGQGKWGWYQIATKLSNMDVPRSPDMMDVLRRLEARGIVKGTKVPDSPRDTWELTEAGKTLLETVSSNSPD